MSLCLVTIIFNSAFFIQRFQVQLKLPSDSIKNLSSRFICFHFIFVPQNLNQIQINADTFPDSVMIPIPIQDNIIVPNQLRFVFGSSRADFKRTAVFNLLK